MIVDLSHPIYTGMPVYPGDPETVVTTVADHDRDGYCLHTISMGSHAATHIDAPRHFLKDAETADSYRVLDACVGPARVFEVRGVPEKGDILPHHLGDDLKTIARGDRILLATGWSGRMGTPGYYDRYPSVSADLARLFVERGIVLLGVETPSLHVSLGSEIHRILLSAGIILIENLTNLVPLAGQRIHFSAAPLKLRGLDGSPVRAYAMTD